MIEIRYRKVIYRNELGQEIIFDCKLFFCEYIDTLGTPCIANTEQLASVHGQKLISRKLGAKTIPCKFAFKDIYNNDTKRDLLAKIFSPMLSGVLTVYNQWDFYSIDVRPAEMPVIQPESPRVFKWEVDFIADYPLWRRGIQKQQTLTSAYTVIRSPCTVNLPLEITFYQSAPFKNNTTNQGFTVNNFSTDFIKVNTLDFSIYNSNGIKASNAVDANDDIGDVYLAPGNNTIFSPTNSETPTVIRYWELFEGVM